MITVTHIVRWKQLGEYLEKPFGSQQKAEQYARLLRYFGFGDVEVKKKEVAV